MLLSALPKVIRNNFAKELASKTDWKYLGLYFEDNPRYAPRILIDYADLVAKFGKEPDVVLCAHLIEELANKAVIVDDVIDALKKMGLVTTAMVLSSLASSHAKAAVPNQNAKEVEVKQAPITPEQLYKDVSNYRDSLLTDPNLPHKPLSTIIEHQKTLYNPKALYNNKDSRRDIRSGTHLERNLSRSVVGLWRGSDVFVNGKQVQLTTKGFTEAHSELHGKFMPLDKDEAFYGQPRGPFGSGFLVHKDLNLIVTAGHCVAGPKAPHISQIRFVFGFEVDGINNISDDDVYTGEILQFRLDSEQDWAIVKLHKQVVNRDSLSIDQQSPVNVKDPVFMIGHPYGLPLKIATEAEILSAKGSMFRANLDAFGGNSGSPVFNAANRVIGILVRGEPDFEWSDEKNAMVAYQVPSTGFEGETAMKISVVPIPEEKIGPANQNNVGDARMSKLKVKEKAAIAKAVAVRRQKWKEIAVYFDINPEKISSEVGTSTLECSTELVAILSGKRVLIEDFKKALKESEMEDVIDEIEALKN
jgi:S1-C subfamily serine protease